MDLPTVGLEPRTSEREAGGRGLEPRTSEREAGAAERGGPASPGLGPWSGNLPREELEEEKRRQGPGMPRGSVGEEQRGFAEEGVEYREKASVREVCT